MKHHPLSYIRECLDVLESIKASLDTFAVRWEDKQLHARDGLLFWHRTSHSGSIDVGTRTIYATRHPFLQMEFRGCFTVAIDFARVTERYSIDDPNILSDIGETRIFLALRYGLFCVWAETRKLAVDAVQNSADLPLASNALPPPNPHKVCWYGPYERARDTYEQVLFR